MSTMNYGDLLRSLGLERLELRRLHADLLTCYKIINNMVAVPFHSFFKFAVSKPILIPVAIYSNLCYQNPE